jgi:hypothetical protein
MARMFAWLLPPSIAESLFNAGHVLAEPSQDKIAFFAGWHLGAKQLEDERIGRLADSPDGFVRSLGFQARKASASHELLWILADGSTTKLDNSVGSETQDDGEGG